MTSSVWQRAQEIFLAALEQPDDARTRFILGETADPAVLTEVRRLLAGHRSEDGMFDIDADGRWRESEGTTTLPLNIGSYRLLEVIGSGGMGTVYRAERSDGQFRKQVAVKLIAGASLSEGASARFRQERQILADLEHAHIARLLDGGVSTDGRQYIVMEYVDGTPVDRYCRDARSKPGRIVSLFRPVCEAVAYAHQKGIVHRDIKPANILIAGDGSPKLLDFGISRLIREPEGQEGGASNYSTMALTPEYCSPEQWSQGSPTPASDVYSLGVVLYELLTGRRFPASQTGQTAPARDGITHGLYAILLKAIDPDPTRRYPSAAEFAEDLRRYSQARPMQAQPRGFMARIGLQLTRPRWRVVALAVLLSVIVGGFTLRRIEHRRESAQRLAVVRAIHQLFYDADARAWRLPNSADARRQLFAEVKQRLASLEPEAAGDPDILREVARCYFSLGQAQGWMTMAVGDFRESLESFGRARVHAEQVLRLSPGLRDVAVLVRILEGCAGTASSLNEFATAERCAVDALSLLQGHQEEYLRVYRVDFASRHMMLYPLYAWSLASQEKHDEAHAAFERAARLIGPLFPSIENNPYARRRMAQFSSKLAEHECETGNSETGMQHARLAERLTTDYRETDGDGQNYRRASSMALGICYLAVGQQREALDIFSNLADLFTRDLLRDPNNHWLRLMVAYCRELEGNASLKRNDLSQAERAYLAALDALRVPQEFSASSMALNYAGRNYAGLGHVARRSAETALHKAGLRNWTDSCENYRRAEQILREREQAGALVHDSRIVLREVQKKLANCSFN